MGIRPPARAIALPLLCRPQLARRLAVSQGCLPTSQQQQGPSCRSLNGSCRQSSTSSPATTSTGSSSSLSQTISDQLRLPRFSARSSRMNLLRTPPAFYKEVKEIIARAQERIFISSLYIGKEETELIGCIRDALQKRPYLRVLILVDALRSTREGPYSSTNTSCASLLGSLARDYPDQVDVRLYRTPGLPLWLEQIIGKRLVEGAGLQHMKVYGGDDEVIISGANLSNDYFTNRQDRYVHLWQHPLLSSYLHSLLLLTSQFSYHLRAAPSCSDAEKAPSHSAYSLEWDQGSRLLLAEDADGSITEAGSFGQAAQHIEHNFSNSASLAIQSFTDRWREHCDEQQDQVDGDAMIVPLLQMGPMKITQETDAMPLILEHAQDSSSSTSRPSLIDFTSGYFSLYPAYKDLLLSLPNTVQTRIITAAPISNGFFGSKGISRHLPPAYTWLQEKFWKAVKAKGKEQGAIEIREWAKEGWTYHAKGVWLTVPTLPAGPTKTLIGSSNFGSRSALRDLECTLLIETRDDKNEFSRSLKEEVEALREDAKDVVSDELFQREERKVHWGVKLATEVIKGRL